MKAKSLDLNRSTLAPIVKVAAILLSTITVYLSDLTVLANEALQSEQMTHILAIPFLLAYLLYRKRKMLKATIQSDTASNKRGYTVELVGILLCLTAFFIYWQGSYTFYPLLYRLASLPIYLTGLTLIFFNVKTLRTLAFPIAFLFFLIPIPSETVSLTGSGISIFTSEAAYTLLKMFGLPVTLTNEYGAPALIVTDVGGSQIRFVIDAACSGIYSLIGFSIFATFITYLSRAAAWRKATLFLTSFLLIYALTIARTTILVLTGYWQGVNVAWDLFHLLGGSTLIFFGSLITLFLAEKIWKLNILSTPKTECTVCSPKNRSGENFCIACGKLLKYPTTSLSKLDIGKIAALTFITGLILTISVPVFALAEGPPEVFIQSHGSEQTTITQVLPQILGYNLSFVYRDTRFEQIAPRDRALMYVYKSTTAGTKDVFVALEIGSSKSTWHSWESSVIIWPQRYGTPYATQLDLRDVELLNNPPLIGRFFAFQHTKSSITQVVLYWYESAVFKTETGSKQKYVKISLVAYPEDPAAIPETEELLLPLAKQVIGFWQTVKTWSLIALTIAQNAAILTTIPTALLTLTLTINTLQDRKKKKTNLKIYTKLASQEEQHILQAVHKIQRDASTSKTIASQYQKNTGKTIQLDVLNEKLEEAEKTGLIQRDIANQNDEPVLTWKSQVPLRKDG